MMHSTNSFNSWSSIIDCLSPLRVRDERRGASCGGRIQTTPKLRRTFILAPLAVFLLALAGCSSNQSGVATGSADESEEAVGVSPAPQEHPRARHSNRLADETSPYLLMHAHNPVDWYPWGEEALEKAQKENKLIFLSIGYSSCYWCHVMERESFMDEEIAGFMNKHFVSIKVDREERPDIDSIYMTSLQLYFQLAGMGQGGGWPLSMFLTPSAQPIMGGTYFPARDGDRSRSRGFLTVIERLHSVWQENPKGLTRNAAQLAEFVHDHMRGSSVSEPVALEYAMLEPVFQELQRQYDEEYGGFGYDPGNPRMPKFPEPSNLAFLIDRVQRSGDEKAREMLVGTLDKMAEGGIRDHIGGGFHRYITDRYWRIPHFEKMLYDNGQLASMYSEAYALTGREEYRQVVVQLLDFVLRELTDEEGAFYAALDAETDAEEGKFYRWTKSEVQELLSDEQWARFAPVYGLDQEPNFEHRWFVPLLTQPLTDRSADAWKRQLTQLHPIRGLLREARDRRPRPLTDTKIITGWNGLMIRGFADAGRILEQPEYVHAAQSAANFVLANLRTDVGRLLRTYGGGQARFNAYLDDYAMLADGLIALYRATDDRRWLEQADQITAKQIELFWDERDGGFFFTSEDHETLIARAKDPVDTVLPAGNSVAADNLVFLAAEMGNAEYLELAEQTIQSIVRLFQKSPTALPRMATAMARYMDAVSVKESSAP